MELKRFLQIFLVILIILILTKTSYALGISPAKVEINFEPNLKRSITYNVYEDNIQREVEVYVDGDLEEYVKLDKKEFTGSGKVIVTLKLPKEIEKPGRHLLFVRAREKVDDELVGGAVGTSVTIGAVIVIHVPSPGR